MTTDFYAPRFDVRISGLTMAADVAAQTLALTVETNLDVAGMFALSLRNLDNTLLDSALFDIGKTVEVHLGYGSELTPAFLGEIAAIEPSFPADGPPTVRVIGYDKSYRMRHNQPMPTVYQFANDAIVAATIAVENGLIPIVDPTVGLVRKLPRSGSDMAFLKSRAKKHFYDVYVEWDRLHFQFPRPTTAAYRLEWGRNLSSFSPRISAAGLAGIELIRDYNQELAQAVYGIAVSMDFDLDNLEERLGSAAIELLGSLIRKGIRTGAPVSNPLDAMGLAKALLADLLDGMYEGSGSCVGIPDLAAGQYITIGGVGKRFSGTYRLRRVTHTVDGNGFRTEFAITQRSNSTLLNLLRDRLIQKPQPDDETRFSGVVVGEVVDTNELLDGELPLGRVRVKFPGLSDDFVSNWAPLARPMAGDGVGFYSLPNSGDQVLVAFEQGNLERPYVIGALWNATAPPPVTGPLAGDTHVIKTRAGHTITFDDTRAAAAVTIESSTGSSITMGPDGSIAISAAGDLTITAANDLTLKAGGNIGATAGVKVSASATDSVELGAGAPGAQVSLKAGGGRVEVS